MLPPWWSYVPQRDNLSSLNKDVYHHDSKILTIARLRIVITLEYIVCQHIKQCLSSQSNLPRWRNSHLDIHHDRWLSVKHMRGIYSYEQASSVAYEDNIVFLALVILKTKNTSVRLDRIVQVFIRFYSTGDVLYSKQIISRSQGSNVVNTETMHCLFSSQCHINVQSRVLNSGTRRCKRGGRRGSKK